MAQSEEAGCMTNGPAQCGKSARAPCRSEAAQKSSEVEEHKLSESAEAPNELKTQEEEEHKSTWAQGEEEHRSQQPVLPRHFHSHHAQ
jgi:hypothetical protein